MQPVPQKGVAARVGYWSARHKKSVLLGWILFVILSVVGGGMISSNNLTEADKFSGESGRAEKTLEQSFPQASTAGEELRGEFGGLCAVQRVRGGADGSGAGLISGERHAAPVSFEIKGDKAEA